MNPDGPLPPRPPQPDQASQRPTGYAPQPPVAPLAPPYAQAPQAQSTNSLAVAALILGILGFFMLPIIGSLLGIVLGVLALGQIKQGKGTGRGMALTGLWLGVASLVITTLLFLIVFAAVPSMQKKTRDVTRKTDMNAIASQIEAYYAQNGYYPAQLSDMPNYSVPTIPPAIGEKAYGYEPTPAGCANTVKIATGGINPVTCTGYTIQVELEDGTKYTKSNTIEASDFDINDAEIDRMLQKNN